MNTPCCPASSTSAVAAAPSAAPLARRPRYTVENSPEAHTLRVDLPGVAKEAVTLKLEEGLLHLTAARASTVPESWKPLHRELSDAGYELRLRLNDRIDESRLTAQLEHGVLTVTLPVRETVKPRSITIE